MKDQRFIIWFVGLFLVLRVVRYVIGARIFLTSAVQDVIVRPCAEEDILSGDRKILMTLDAQLAHASFHPLGYVSHQPFLTYYGEADHSRIFAHESEPIEAYVSRRMAPEYGSSANVQLVTRLTQERSLVTGDLAMSIHISVPTVSVETIGGASLPELMARHRDRIRAVSSHEIQTGRRELEAIAAAMTVTYAAVRNDLRARGWCVQSNDPGLDRVTLRGAFGLVDQSKKAFGPKGVSLATVGEATEVNRQLRTEADFQCVRRVARSPRTAPGVPWPLLIIMGAAALASVVGMAALWNIQVAFIIFVVILVHEAGHALTMRVVGHSAVHIFFVPFLGALTIGRSMNASVRERLAILLAGPVPGLLIGIALLALYEQSHDRLWRGAAIGFVLINALNLLPVIPLDGGRFFETLTRPEGITRFVLQLSSSIGLLALAIVLKDPVFSGLAVLSLLLLPRQWLAFRFRRMLGRQLVDRRDWLGVVRTALVVMTEPQFSSWRSRGSIRHAGSNKDRLVGRVGRVHRGNCDPHGCLRYVGPGEGRVMQLWEWARGGVNTHLIC